MKGSWGERVPWAGPGNMGNRRKGECMLALATCCRAHGKHICPAVPMDLSKNVSYDLLALDVFKTTMF